MSGLEIWAMAAMWMALLSWRLPPRLSRWRTTRPLLASMGAVPLAIAKRALVVNRAGSPVSARISAATSGPTP